MSAIVERIREDLKVIKANSQMAKRLDAFRVVFEKIGRILSGHPIRVVMSVVGSQAHTGMPNVPGWTDGETVYLNADVIRNDLGRLSMSDIVLHTKAVFYHELCHVIFSPRMRDDIMKWIMNQQHQTQDRLWWYAFNALEDQRIESLFVAKYRPAAPYFEAIALKWLVNNQASLSEAFPLVYGRKFLRADIVDKSRAAFVARYGEGMAQDFERVINRFTILKFPDHTVAAQKAISEYRDLLQRMMQQHPQMNGMPTPTLLSDDNGGANGPTHRDDPTVVRKNNARKRDQQSAIDHLDEIKPREPSKPDNDKKSGSDKAHGASDDDGDEEDGDDGASGSDADDTGDTGQAGSGQAGDSSSDDGDQQGDDDGDSQEGTGQSSQGASTGGTPAPEQEVIDAVYEALDELFEDQSFLDELAATADAIHKSMDDEGLANGDETPSTMTPVRPEVIRSAKQMARQLGRLRSELEEQHLYRQIAGTVHPKRFLSRQPWDVDFFKVYEPGLVEAADLEAVVLVDLSYSMQPYMGAVNEALWTVKRALDTLDSRVTVLGFSERSFILYQPTERVGRTQMRSFSARSGTTPDQALEEAHRLFRVSRRTQKLLVSITDGDWQGDRQRQDRLVLAMRAMEVVTCLIGIGAAPKGVDHQHQIVYHLPGIEEMPKVAVQIVAEALKNLLHDIPVT